MMPVTQERDDAAALRDAERVIAAVVSKGRRAMRAASEGRAPLLPEDLIVALRACAEWVTYHERGELREDARARDLIRSAAKVWSDLSRVERIDVLTTLEEKKGEVPQ